ncbi:uncharacterized protein LOC108221700 isoform X2 [Daucus carota subsp. sativus]|uniref:uncharacterized protein LOC108221700 isoform X2 n=1 Tax=Daucus carota subsp. sativus TaxID=79200 RepID=UPI003083992D
MLQWMGGSRRKVTASRKSTHKRQKQYFEQRKQQQHQESAWKDGSSDITNTCTQRSTNSQSLDILSLRDLKTVDQEHRSSFHDAKDILDGNILTLDSRTTPELPKMHTSQVASADRTESGGESYQLKTVDPERASMNFQGSHDKDSSGSGKAESLEMPNDLRLSVLDLLGDDGPNSNLEGDSLHETHVAFSVEGLGKVGMETPVHSPHRPIRDFPYGCSLSSRVTENTHSAKNFMSRQDDFGAEAMQDYMGEDDDISYHGSKLPSSLMMDSFSYFEHEKVTGKGRLQIIDKGSYSNNIVGTEYIFNNEYGNDKMWDESCTLPDNDFLFKRKCQSSWKTRPYQRNSNSPDYFNFENHVENDFAFQGTSINTSRGCTGGMHIFDNFDPITPYAKHQLPENHPDFTNPKGTWFPNLQRTTSVRSVINQPAWSSFESEDERENLSFLSEDFCSSSSGWYKSSGIPQFDLLGKKTRAHGSEYRSPVRRNRYCHELDCKKQESENCPIPTANFQKRKGPHEKWLFEDEDVTGSKISGLGSFCQTSGFEDSQPSSFQQWNEDLYNVDSVPEIQVDATSFSESPCGDFQAKRSPFCLEKLECCKPKNCKHSSETSFLTKTSSRSVKSTSSPVFGVGGNTRYPVRGIVCRDEIPQCERNCLNRQNELELSEPSTGKPEHHEDACDGSNCLSSENKNAGDDLDAGDSCSHFNVGKDKSQEMECLRETCFPEQAEYVSSIKILEAPDSTESDLEGQMKEDDTVSSYHKNVQTHLSQNKCEDIEESVPKERNMESMKKKNITDSSSQGMVLESFAIQLLSVHVLKEASNWGIGNKEN